MADDGFKDLTVTQADVSDTSKVTKESTRAINDNTQAIQANTRAHEHWGRLAKDNRQEQEKLLAVMKEEGKAAVSWTKQLFSLRRQYDDVKHSVGGFANQLANMATISATYQRKLEAMREGQKSFSKTLLATTDDLSAAQAKSQRYVNAVHEAYANAHRIAGEFRVESQALKQAVGELNARFATQIAASGDMQGAMQGMQRDAFILGRYLGVEMTDVMDMWQDRLNQTIGTLEESRKEVTEVAYVTDQYARELKALGGEYMKTGNIGKTEFLEMVRSVGRELRTGTIDTAGYARALKGLLVAGEEGLLTVNEHRVAAEGVKKMLSGVFRMGEEGSLFGTEVAKKIISQWDDLTNIQNEGLRRRLEMVRANFGGAPEIQQLRAVMDVLRGSAAGNAEALRQMSGMMGGVLSREFIAKYTEGNLVIANQISEQIRSGKMAADFDEKATKDASKERGQQVDVWKKSIENLVKATHTPKDLDYKLIAEVEQIRNLLQSYIASSPWLAIGGQLAGALIPSLGRWAVGKMGGMFAQKALGRAAAGAAGTGAQVGFRAAPAGVSQALGAGLPRGPATTLGRGALFGGRAGAALGGAGRLGLRALPGVGAALTAAYLGTKAVNALSEELMSTQTKLATGGAHFGDYLDIVIAHGEDYIQEVTRLEGAEYEKKKKNLDLIDKRITDLKQYGENMTLVERETVKALQEQKKQIESEIGRRKKKETKEATAEGKRHRAERQARLTSRLQKMDITGAESPDELARRLLFDQIAGTERFGIQHLTGAGIGEDVQAAIAALPEAMRGRIQDPRALVETVQYEVRRLLAQERGMSPEQLRSMTAEGIKVAGQKTTGAAVAPVAVPPPAAVQGAQEAQEVLLRVVGEGGEGGGPSVVRLNAKGEVEMKQTTTTRVDGASLYTALRQAGQQRG